MVANEAAAALFGVSVGELSDTTLSAIPVDLLDDRGHLLGEDRLPLMRALQGEEVRGQVVRFVRRDGSLLWVEVHANPLYDGNGAQYGAVASYDDVTARVEQDRRTRHEADTDVLTGLANRRALERTLEAALARAGTRSRSVGVVMLDLDGFKAINDSRGHAAGDAALREVAARLRRCVRERDLVARLGGDEFVIVLTDLDDGTRAVRRPRRPRARRGSPRRSASRSCGPRSAWPCSRPRAPPPPTCSRTPIGRCTWTRARATARCDSPSGVDDPVILTCAISGALASRDQCPAIPYTPAEYAAEARRIADEGGVMVHIHARTPDGTPSYAIEDFRAITDAIRAEVGRDLIINYSTGALGVPIETRQAYLRELRPEVGALNMGSMNYAKYSARRKDFVFKAVFENSFDTIGALLGTMVEHGIRPEHECFDSGHVASLDPLLDMGALKPPLQVSFVMGVTGGIRPTARNVAHMAEQVPDVPHQWGVIGISRAQWGLLAAALSLGGNIRVGLEDNFYLPDGEMARSNGDLVARGARMAGDAGRRLATVDEARELLGLS